MFHVADITFGARIRCQNEPMMNNFADQKQAAAAIFEYIEVFYSVSPL